MEVKKTGTGIKVLVGMLIFLLCAAIGYIVADKFILNKTESNTTNNVVNKEEGTVAKEENTAANSTQECKTTNNDWNFFVSNVKATRNKQVSESWDRVKHVCGGNMCEIEYIIKLSKDGILSIEYNDKKYEIAKNVVLYADEMTGNGGAYYLYYSTEDGILYKADVDGTLYDKKEKVDITKTNYKNIVTIMPSDNTEGPAPVFIDINGNSYTFSYEY